MDWAVSMSDPVVDPVVRSDDGPGLTTRMPTSLRVRGASISTNASAQSSKESYVDSGLGRASHDLPKQGRAHTSVIAHRFCGTPVSLTCR
jgi:hypothetical protein